MQKLPAALLGLLLLGHLAAIDEPAYQAAIELYRQHQWPAAQTAFEALVATDPAHPGVQTYLGRLALQRNDPAVAVVHLEKAAALNPTDSRTHQWLGDAYGLSALKAGLFSKMSWAGKCRIAYEKAVELDPNNIKARTSLLNYYLQAPSIAGGSPEKAMGQARAIHELDPTQGRLLIANVHVAEKKYDLAFALFDEALRQNADDYAILFQFGRLASLSGQRLDEGLAALRHCLTLTPPLNQPGAGPVHGCIGTILEKKGDKPGARQAYETALAAEPGFAPATTALSKL